MAIRVAFNCHQFFCTVVDRQESLIDCIVPDIQTRYVHQTRLAERPILAAKNVDVEELIFHIQDAMPFDLVSYKSIDTVCDSHEAVNYPTEF